MEGTDEIGPVHRAERRLLAPHADVVTEVLATPGALCRRLAAEWEMGGCYAVPVKQVRAWVAAEAVRRRGRKDHDNEESRA